MCGIGGAVNYFGIVQHSNFAEALDDELKHRGPDDFGSEIFESNGKNIALLLHRRLSVLGLGKAGHQPMFDDTHRFCISFNGEIYNYIELAERFQLENTSGTDTQILLQLWQKMGSECLALLDGFFAFALWDKVDRTLVLVRDSSGVKPLYYCLENDSIWFASEDFALNRALETVGLGKLINSVAIKSHIEKGSSDSEPLFNGINALPIGGLMRISENTNGADRALTTELEQWDNQLSPPDGYSEAAEKMLANFGSRDLLIQDFMAEQLGISDLKSDAELLRRQLTNSMRRRLRSDVPIGFAVSGGLDSAVLVALAREILGESKTIHLFSVNAPGMVGDERDFQKSVVEKVGAIWHEVRADEMDASLLQRYIKMTHRVPVAWNNLAHFALCEAVKKAGVTVLFNGQGADELFGGYPHYYKAAFWTERPTLWYHRTKWPLGFWQAGMQWFKYSVGGWLGGRAENCVDRLMADDFYGARLNQLLRFEDRNGMAFGLESRNPFADDRMLAKTWLNVWTYDTADMRGSLTYRLFNGYSKGVLRSAMQLLGEKDLVPEAVLWRIDKKGFTVPSDEMSMRALSDWEGWIMSGRLDILVRPGRRRKALARAQKDSTVLTQLFRWAAMGCFLETFDLEVDL